MKVIDLLGKELDDAYNMLADDIGKYMYGYRRGKYGWILPSYKGKGRPRKEDYEKTK